MSETLCETCGDETLVELPSESGSGTSWYPCPDCTGEKKLGGLLANAGDLRRTPWTGSMDAVPSGPSPASQSLAASSEPAGEKPVESGVGGAHTRVGLTRHELETVAAMLPTGPLNSVQFRAKAKHLHDKLLASLATQPVETQGAEDSHASE